MNGYNFTEQVHLVIANARAEAARLRHEYIGTEHLLLGLLRADAGVGAVVIDSFGVDAADIATKLEAAIKGGHGSGTSVDLPYTSRAKKVFELAMAEATRLNHAYVGTEHLLLGVISEGDGIAARMLREFGITLEPVFAAQGVDIPKLITALRKRAHGKPDVERSSEPPADAPPPT